MAQEARPHGATPLPCVLGYRAAAWWRVLSYAGTFSKLDRTNIRVQSQITWFSQRAQWGLGGEELRLQSREGQELSAAAAAGQLILKMSSEDQTMDPRDKLMGNDHGTIFVRFRAV